jgi:site-specific DNA recombinase
LLLEAQQGFSSHGQPPSEASRSAILKAIARARLWYDQIVAGEANGFEDLAQIHGLTPCYVRRIFRFASLGPDVVESIIKGGLRRHRYSAVSGSQIPMEWDPQRSIILER